MASKKRIKRKSASRKAARRKAARAKAVHIPQPVKRGARMTKGKKWALYATKGAKRYFRGTLLETINRGKERLAIFSVPK